jgi:hypothetical protein
MSEATSGNEQTKAPDIAALIRATSLIFRRGRGVASIVSSGFQQVETLSAILFSRGTGKKILEPRISRSLSSGAHSHDSLAHPGHGFAAQKVLPFNGLPDQAWSSPAMTGALKWVIRPAQ